MGIVDIKNYYDDLKIVLMVAQTAAAKTFAYKRMGLLE